MKGKKILAATLAVAMVLGSSMTAFASNPNVDYETEDGGTFTKDNDEWNDGIVGGEVEGGGEMAGFVDKNVFHVMLPVENDDLLKSALNFKLDPLGLITDTNGEQFGNGSNFDSGKTLYFPNVGATTSAGIYWTDTSNHFTVTNKGSVEVDVTVDAELSNLKVGGSTITVSEDGDYDGDTSASMYMAIKTDEDVDPNVGAALVPDAKGEKATVSITAEPIGAVSASAFKVERKADGSGYAYVLDESAVSDYDKFSFWLQGTSNPNGDWDAVKENVAPKLKLTWKVKPHTDSYLDVSTISASNTRITPTLPSGVTVAKMEITCNGKTSTMEWSTHFTKDGSTFVIVPEKVKYWVGGQITFTYSDGRKDVVAIQ